MSSKSSRGSKRARQEVAPVPADRQQEPELGIRVIEQRTSGPLPPPDVLARYDSIHPGFADRIVRMAEQNSAHRRTLEDKTVTGNVEAQRRGQVLAFVLALALMVFAGVLVFCGQTAEGVAIIIAEIAALAGTFVWGRNKQARERAEKRMQNP